MFTITMLVIAIICYAALTATYKPQATYRNGMLFAVTLPAHAMDHAGIQSIRTQFRKRFNLASVWMVVTLVPFVVLHFWMAYQTIYFFVWFFTFFIVMVIPFRRAFRETLALKRENEWYVGNKGVVYSDLRVAQLKNQRAASLWLFTIPFAISTGTMLWAVREDIELAGVTSGGFVLTAMLFFIWLYMRKAKAKVYSMNSEVNLVLNQARRRTFSYTLLFMAIVETIHFLLMYLLAVNENADANGVWLTVILLFTVVPIGILYYAYRHVQALEQEVLAHDGKVIYTDDDEYWANGFTYHNPHDNSVFVTKRVGFGETVNTATWAGKIIAWGSVGIAAVVIIGVSFMLIRSELTSPVLSVTPDHKLAIEYPMYSFDVSLADVEQVALVDSVPSGIKTNGEATDTYARGHFRLQGLGKSRLYIFKNNPPYIQIKLTDGYVFYNEKEPQKTKQLFEQLQKEVGK
ncbi:UNVERIFIED_CONTAM: putative membrane protein [Brevibacillus sp. OAP136]